MYSEYQPLIKQYEKQKNISKTHTLRQKLKTLIKQYGLSKATDKKVKKYKLSLK